MTCMYITKNNVYSKSIRLKVGQLRCNVVLQTNLQGAARYRHLTLFVSQSVDYH